MRGLVGLTVLTCLVLGTPSWGKDPIADSVVKVYATRREPDFSRPWSKGSAQESSGSGVILAGKRILTNAHVVSYSNQLLVQANQSSERVAAKVVAFATGMDLAILEVASPAFFEGRPALPLAQDLPAMKQPVSVYGYPMGGEQLSVTQGVVSRIEYSDFNLWTSGMRIQIDAALNPGNSGGPAVADGKIVGLVFSKLGRESQAENIGYLVAAEEIAAFLKDIEDGVYQGKPMLADLVQPAENDALRAKLGLKQEEGVVVYRPLRNDPDYPLKQWDVILKIGDQPIDRLGNVKIKDDLKLHFRYLIPKLAKDGRVEMTVLRGKQTCQLQVPVASDPHLVMPFLEGKYPRYFIFGPVVFMAASQDFMLRLAVSAGAQLTMIQSPLLSRGMDQRAFEGEEIVVLGSSLLSHPMTKGYTPFPFSVVTRLNGTAVRNLAHLVQLVRDSKDEFLSIDLAGRVPPLVLRRQEALQATEEILTSEGIRKQCSEDLERLWQPPK